MRRGRSLCTCPTTAAVRPLSSSSSCRRDLGEELLLEVAHRTILGAWSQFTNRPFTQRSRLEDATTSSTHRQREARFGPNATFGPTATTMPASAHERPANLPEGPREESLFVLPEGSLAFT